MNLASTSLWETKLSSLKKISEKPWFYPAALLLIGLLSYGYALTSMGYFWDDWEVVFLLNTKNLPLLYGYFAFDRPFAWPYQLMYSMFAMNPIAWHLMTLLLRWGGILLLYLTLRLLWPRYDSYFRWLGALLIVYPGFFQQSISAAYNRHFTAFFLFGLSIYLMALAVKQPKRAWFLFPLSWLLAFIQVFTIEYFVGLELIRPLVLWFLIYEEKGKRIRGSIRQDPIAFFALFDPARILFLVAIDRFPDHRRENELCRRFQDVSGFPALRCGRNVHSFHACFF